MLLTCVAMSVPGPCTALADLVASGNTALLDFEIAFGQRSPNGWIVCRSTLPWLENTAVAMQVKRLDEARLELDFNGDVQCWNVLEWPGMRPCD